MFKLLRSENFLFKFLLGLMVFIPLYPKFPLLNIPNTYIAIRFEDVLAGALFLAWLYINLGKLKQFIRLPIYQSILLFWLIGGLSLLSALLITHSVTFHLGFLHWMRRVEYMLFFIIAATTIRSIDQVKTILKAGLVVTLVVVFYGFGQEWLKFPVISTTNREFSKGLILFLSPDARVNSTFAGHYDLAVFLTIVLIYMGSLFYNYKKITDKIILAISGMLSFALLGLTAARVSFVATLLGLTISFWINGKKILVVLLVLLSLGILIAVPDLRHRFVATLTVNILGGGGPKYQPSGPPPNLNKLSESSKEALFKESISTASGKTTDISSVPSDIAPGEPVNYTELEVQRSYGIRLDVEWPRALRAFYKNPILGTGYSSIMIATDNDLLRSLGEVGLMGTMAQVLVFIILFKQMIKFIRVQTGFEKSYITGSFCMLIAVLITGAFIDVLEASKVATIFWFLLGTSWAVMRNFQDT